MRLNACPDQKCFNGSGQSDSSGLSSRAARSVSCQPLARLSKVTVQSAVPSFDNSELGAGSGSTLTKDERPESEEIGELSHRLCGCSAALGRRHASAFSHRGFAR